MEVLAITNKSEKPVVYVIGRNYCNILTMARAFGVGGYTVEVVRLYKKKPNRMNFLQRMKPDACCKYIKSFHEFVVENNTEKVLQYLISIASSEKKTILFPVDDYSVCLIDEFLELLERYYDVPNIMHQNNGISKLMNKQDQKRIAQALELPVLRSSLIQCEGSIFQIPDDIVYPCFIKPNVSMNSSKASMKKCINQQELRQTLSEYAEKGDFSMLIEEFAEIKTEYSLLGVSTPEGVIAPALFKTITGGHRERKGVAMSGELLECEKFGTFIEECLNFVQSLHYEGVFDIDFIETKDGKIYFLEINFRAGASTYAFLKAGINLAVMYADYLVYGKALDFSCKIEKEGLTFVSEKVLFEEYIRSDITWHTVKTHLRNADIYFIKDEADLGPYRCFNHYLHFAFLIKWIYTLYNMLK